MVTPLLIDQDFRSFHNYSKMTMPVQNDLLPVLDNGKIEHLSGKNMFQTVTNTESNAMNLLSNFNKGSFVEMEEPVNKSWTAVKLDNSFLKGTSNFSISYKHRRQTPQKIMEDRLYSSLKYEILLSAEASDLKTDCQFLLARIFVVEADGEVLLQNKLNGSVETALTKQPNLPNSYFGKMRVQFDSNLSFHKTKKEHKWQVHFFEPENLQNSVLVMESPAFKIFARKPDPKKKEKKKKRKRDQMETVSLNHHTTSPIQQPFTPNKKTKFDQFMSVLNDIVGLTKGLNHEDKLKAKQLVLRKFQSNDFVEHFERCFQKKNKQEMSNIYQIDNSILLKKKVTPLTLRTTTDSQFLKTTTMKSPTLSYNFVNPVENYQNTITFNDSHYQEPTQMVPDFNQVSTKFSLDFDHFGFESHNTSLTGDLATFV